MKDIDPVEGRVGSGRAGMAARLVEPTGATVDRSDAAFVEYWDWIAVALFLLTTVDTLTTIYAASLHGFAGEANPLMEWVIRQGVGSLLVVNLLVVVLVGALFHELLRHLKRTPPPYDRYLATLVEVWIGVLVAAGLGTFANNLAVIVLGSSLI